MNQLAVHGGEPVRDSFLVFGKPAIEQSEIDEVVDCMNVGWLGTGPKVHKFENNFRNYIGCQNAVAVNSCTAALHLALVVSGIGVGDEVITTPMTFCATANVILHVGATPVFADIDVETMNIDPAEIEKKITSRTKAIIPVHFAGRPCKMDVIWQIAKKYNLLVIEDAAHAIESEFQGKKVGNIGHITCFSFYSTKNLVTGEGGMVTLNNDELTNKIKVYALHGMDKDAWKRYSDQGFKHYQVVAPGYKYNMMDIQAAMGIHQLERLEKNWLRRQEIWQKYNKAFADLPVITPRYVDAGDKHAYHLYTLLIDKDKCGIDRDNFQQYLFKENIGTGIHFTALHLHEYYKNTFGYNQGDFPKAEYISDRTISLPLAANLTDKDVADVICAVRKVLEETNIQKFQIQKSDDENETRTGSIGILG
ncbi:UDP-4-amino-4,6-dideoxy-N-acetyl-beta-L-altrosamine transaminase [Candidatus Falkowbacteria bacterium RIFOXYA2_FULL_35_8]|uniref:UDP-4-amino-4, 6-dideoxy-N-acetyl-beta-L-altrosamine transaminase n=1 Tax=Candidatus Falkowbacteria bacterium RIFOXYC2_FULL_36_12 TaxID=1798002 RepID=A0A1F5T0X1_9BACT|nr:MAG: UDP-4-amino-4,6-dideoxy-N-acetyl-beta-L-altrosamine transaminase [Candidatus Falkowbacteria bacterium RIFOXYB2_FULL_35_7]OGF32386.1 MAG: UDP-4-amino-4,6-dideoxy-N-acetyl-beta-L-altrosamine transaminase [Candidatus Falkowbacteria bacterium RIFOXYC2_FULL_36_12]OGF34730.1 MAG: UDP-4-amino-4,6-dideoxy-N-acetyl-beta-L-altrosamine transaminase [Candidatus Falkowbacteria bacterium RIFOXYA2_FULL_35_8]